jgi:hypothetical protein
MTSAHLLLVTYLVIFGKPRRPEPRVTKLGDPPRKLLSIVYRLKQENVYI